MSCPSMGLSAPHHHSHNSLLLTSHNLFEVIFKLHRLFKHTNTTKMRFILALASAVAVSAAVIPAIHDGNLH